METVTVSEFIEKYGLSMTTQYMGSNYRQFGDDDQWAHDDWKCVLVSSQDGRRKLTVDFSMGTGHDGEEPSLESVLDSLRLDAESGEMGFFEFCDEFGYDNDSRSAEKTYKACVHMNRRLKKFMGEKYQELLETERL